MPDRTPDLLRFPSFDRRKNDHDTLRGDPAWQTALERDDELASSPTLRRLEQRAGRRTAVAFHEVLFAKFVASFPEAPAELILDFDATDDRVRGRQGRAATSTATTGTTAF